jgi:uncharacterized protein (DUF2384 family)
MQLQPISTTPFDGGSIEISDVEGDALARATLNLLNAWKLTDAQARIMLGGLSAHAWTRWKDGDTRRMQRDQKIRMAHLIGIHTALRHLFKDPSRGYDWITAPNSALNGISALDFMLSGQLADILFMREWLEAERNM